MNLEGDVWWANSIQDRLVLRDASGTAELEMDLAGRPVQCGQRVRVEGNGIIARRGAGFRLGIKGPAVDNNGVHSLTEKMGTTYLPAGWHPVRVDWFNGVEKHGLRVEYEGPDVPRQSIPDSALAHRPAGAPSGSSSREAGLGFRGYEGIWQVLPDFAQLPPVKLGTTANFNLSVRTRDEHVGLQFTGLINVPRDGAYTFYLQSDDGSQLFVGDPSLSITVLGQAGLPEPRPMAIGQTLDEKDEGQWATIEGKVTRVRDLRRFTSVRL